MLTPGVPSPDAPPALPPGWLAHWSPEHNAWQVGQPRIIKRAISNILGRFYVFTASGATQWEYPAAPPPAPPPDRPQYSPVPDPQVSPASQPPDAQAVDTPTQDGERGFGKTAMALGGGYLVGSHFGHKTDHHGLGKMAMAGAGAIGAKIWSRFGNKPQQQQQQQPAQTYTQVHVHQVYVPGPQSPGPQPPPSYGEPTLGGQNYGHPATGGPSPAPVPPQHYQSVHNSPAIGGMSPFAPQGGPPLYIHGAVFADKDVTQIVRGLVTPQQTLTLTGGTLVEKLGDPWPEVERKSFNVLYSYGDRPMELLAAETNTTNIEIKNEALSKKRMGFCHPPPSRIIACVWGVEDPLT
ncbi:hypothetical protein ACJ41O_007286 [Fusarium nematophilum]